VRDADFPALRGNQVRPGSCACRPSASDHVEAEVSRARSWLPHRRRTGRFAEAAASRLRQQLRLGSETRISDVAARLVSRFDDGVTLDTRVVRVLAPSAFGVAVDQRLAKLHGGTGLEDSSNPLDFLSDLVGGGVGWQNVACNRASTVLI
jgi:hypothetical protein